MFLFSRKLVLTSGLLLLSSCGREITGRGFFSSPDDPWQLRVLCTNKLFPSTEKYNSRSPCSVAGSAVRALSMPWDCSLWYPPLSCASKQRILVSGRVIHVRQVQVVSLSSGSLLGHCPIWVKLGARYASVMAGSGCSSTFVLSVWNESSDSFSLLELLFAEIILLGIFCLISFSSWECPPCLPSSSFQGTPQNSTWLSSSSLPPLQARTTSCPQEAKALSPCANP